MAKKKNERPKLPVRDAKRDLILHITEDDIGGSKKKDSDYCAAAHALCRQENFATARVHKTMTYVMHKDGTVTRYTTPKSLYLELMIFDRGGRMQAADYRLEAPRGVKRLGQHYKPKGKGKTGKLHTVAHHVVTNVRDDAPRGIKSLQSLFE